MSAVNEYRLFIGPFLICVNSEQLIYGDSSATSRGTILVSSNFAYLSLFLHDFPTVIRVSASVPRRPFMTATQNRNKYLQIVEVLHNLGKHADCFINSDTGCGNKVGDE